MLKEKFNFLFKNGKFRISLIIIIPFLFFFSYPPFKTGFLFILGTVLLLLLIEKLNKKQKFLYVFSIFFIYWLVVMQWLLFIDIDFEIYQRILIFFGFIIFSAILSIVWSFPFLIVNTKGKSIYFIPVFAAGIEFLCSIENNTAFLWLTPAHSMLEYLPLMQIADLGGSYLVTAFVLFLSITVYRLFSKDKNERILNLFLLIIIFNSVFVYGMFKISLNPSRETIKAVVIQPNIPSIIKKDFYASVDIRRERISEYLEILKDEEQDIIVFPETASPDYIQRTSGFPLYLREFAIGNKKNILMGSLRLRYSPSLKSFHYYNSAFFINDTVAHYDKLRPLGFAERLPFDDKFKFLRKIPFGQSDFSPGGDFTVFDADNYRFSVYICFESLFPTIPAKFTRKSSQFLVNISEDVWFTGTIAPIHHFAIGIFRAVENRRYVLRASNPGISAIIDDKGRIINKLDLYTEGIISSFIYLNNEKTFYTKYDNLIPKLFVIIMLIYIVFKIKRRFYAGNKS